MKVTLAESWTNRLLTMPESGMGYQRVDIAYTDGTFLREIIVINASLIDIPEAMANKEIKDIHLSSDKPRSSSGVDSP